MIPKVEVFQAIRDWNAVPYVPISEAERKLRQTDCALTVGAYLVLNGAHTKEAFLTNFLEALGPTAEGFAKTAYTVNMATHGFGDKMESWDLPLEERKRRAEKMVFAEAAEQALRELKAEEEKRPVTARSSHQALFWIVVPVVCVTWIFLVSDYETPKMKMEIWRIWYQSPELFWTGIAWVFAASIAIVDTRILQAKRQGNYPEGEPEISTGFAMIFHFLEWAFFLGTMILEWRVGLMLCVIIFGLKMFYILELLGQILMRPFRGLFQP